MDHSNSRVVFPSELVPQTCRFLPISGGRFWARMGQTEAKVPQISHAISQRREPSRKRRINVMQIIRVWLKFVGAEVTLLPSAQKSRPLAERQGGTRKGVGAGAAGENVGNHPSHR